MKTAISLPDQLFEEAERLASRLKLSRSELYAQALAEYVARRSPDRVTAALDRVCEEVGDQPDEFVQRAAHRVLSKSEW